MPIYEYQCQDCQHKFELMQRMSAALQTTCPSCGKEALKKLVSAVGFQLKGTGWYETDFKTKPKAKPDGDGDSAPKSDSAGKSDLAGKSDSAGKSDPAPKSESSSSSSDSGSGSSSSASSSEPKAKSSAGSADD